MCVLIGGAMVVDWWCYGGCWGLLVIGGWVFGVLGYGGILEQFA